MDLQKPDAYKNINTSQSRNLDQNYVPVLNQRKLKLELTTIRPLTVDELQERKKDLFTEEEGGQGLYCYIL